MKRYLLTSLLLLACSARVLLAEEMLKVRPKDTPKERPQKTLTHSDANDFSSFKPSFLRLTSIQFHIVTPLIQEIFPEKRFRAWGNSLSASFPLFQLSEKGFFHLEPGVGITIIRLSLSQPQVDFSHLFVAFPVHGRIVYEINSQFFAEAFLGLILRPWENDTREPPDGGFHRTTENTFAFDAGIGAGWFLNDNLFGRLNFGIQWLSLGFGILL